MNSFRDSLNRQLERLKTKIENHLQGSSGSSSIIKFDDKRLSAIAMKLQDEIIDAKEPLIISLLGTVQDEIQTFHKHLRSLSQNQDDK